MPGKHLSIVHLRRYPRRAAIHAGLILVGGGLLTGCGLPSQLAPAPKRLPRLGFLSPTARPPTPAMQAIFQVLGELGYVDGETIAIESRWAEDREERLPSLAAELVALPVDVLYGWNTVSSRALKTATGTIPIVFGPVADPIGVGLVTNLARPEGNATGIKFSNEGLSAKRLELLKEALPGRTQVAALGYAAGLAVEADWAETQAAGRSLGLDVRRYDVRTIDDFEGVFGAIASDRSDALLTLGDSFLARNAARVVELAERHRLPAMYEHRSYPDAGGLMSYGLNIVDGHRRAATYVAKILKGARPADLPVEQPSSFDFVVNLKAARSLGSSLPQSIVQQATQVIQS